MPIDTMYSLLKIAKDLLPLLFDNKMRFSRESVCLLLELGHFTNVGHCDSKF